MYREGLSLQPWQRAFVTESVKHRRWFGVVRLLLADEVGLGKTLSLGTAALTLALLDADNENTNVRPRPVAILAPASLTEQWQTEMIDKLGVACARWDSRKKAWLDPDGRFISPVGAAQISRCPFRFGIISTGLIIQPTYEKELLSRMNFDILILDESHKARSRRGPGKDEGEPNALLSFMQDAAGRARHVLLGTATPMQTRVEDLWDQLSMLHRGDGRFGKNLKTCWSFPLMEQLSSSGTTRLSGTWYSANARCSKMPGCSEALAWSCTRRMKKATAPIFLPPFSTTRP